MESLPPELVSFIQQMRSLFRAEVFESFCYLLTGILIGEAKQGTVRSSVFAPESYWPQRLSESILLPQSFTPGLHSEDS